MDERRSGVTRGRVGARAPSGRQTVVKDSKTCCHAHHLTSKYTRTFSSAAQLCPHPLHRHIHGVSKNVPCLTAETHIHQFI